MTSSTYVASNRLRPAAEGMKSLGTRVITCPRQLCSGLRDRLPPTSFQEEEDFPFQLLFTEQVDDCVNCWERLRRTWRRRSTAAYPSRGRRFSFSS